MAAVVDARYCAAADQATAFAVARVMGATDRDFAVTDAGGETVMRVEGAVFSLRRRTLLLDARAASRVVVTMLDTSGGVGVVAPTWDVFRGESSSRRDLLFSVVKESVVQVRTRVFVYLSGYRSVEQQPDFVIRGSYYDGDCSVFAANSDQPIAKITENLAGTVRGFTRHVYTTRINPGIDQAFIISLAVILHGMHHR
uniref:Tubby C-terminal domain-containing protein n=1 Tax=Leersia perrieri TaxID=77586 RepID=A0A0D9W0P4_9ORYZ